jgi:hypothetical protein
MKQAAKKVKGQMKDKLKKETGEIAAICRLPPKDRGKAFFT